MRVPISITILAILVNGLLLCKCSGFQFILNEKSKKCFKEDFPLSTDVKLTYHVAQGDGEMPININIFEEGNQLILSRKSIDHGVYGFKTPDKLPEKRSRNEWTMHDDDKLDANFISEDDPGDNHITYSFCFEHKSSIHLPHLSFHSKTQQRRILFDIRSGSGTKDNFYYEKLAKEEHLTSTEELFQVVEDRVSEIVNLIDEMQQRQVQMDRLVAKTTRSVTAYNILASATIVIAALIASHSTISFLWHSKLR